jgi:NTP pyrophosphatase (non-canonical NTP hydrolase)
MAKIVFKRCSLTLDLATIDRCKQLAAEKAQSVSALVRLLVGEAYEEAAAAKREERASDDC